MATQPRDRTGSQPPRHSKQQTYWSFRPKAEWKEEDDATLLVIYLPGFMKEQVYVMLKYCDDTTSSLKVQGQRPIASGRWSDFAEVYKVPETCDASKITCRFGGGVLTISMPKMVVTRQADSVVEDDHAKKKCEGPSSQETAGQSGRDKISSAAPELATTAAAAAIEKQREGKDVISQKATSEEMSPKGTQDKIPAPKAATPPATPVMERRREEKNVEVLIPRLKATSERKPQERTRDHEILPPKVAAASVEKQRTPMRQTYECFRPKSEWKDKNDATLLLIYLPGFTRERLRAMLFYGDDTTLSLKVQGQRAIETGRWSQFTEVYKVPETCDNGKITCKLGDGVLTISMPKMVTTKQTDKISSAAPEVATTSAAAAIEKKREGKDIIYEKTSEEMSQKGSTLDEISGPKEAEALAEKQSPKGAEAPGKTQRNPMLQIYESFKPKSEWKHKNDATLLLIYLPGFMRERLRAMLTFREDTTISLKVQGQRPIASGRWSQFKEVYKVPETCDPSRITCLFGGGVLTISMPRMVVIKQTVNIVADDQAKTKCDGPSSEETAAQASSTDSKNGILFKSVEALSAQKPEKEEKPQKGRDETPPQLVSTVNTIKQTERKVIRLKNVERGK